VKDGFTMEIRDFALRILESPDLETKLSGPRSRLADARPGPALRAAGPARDERLRMVPAREARVPPIAGFPDPAQRPRILHALANHELQAVELFAWALLAFPDSPAEFRRGLLRILREEQMHCRLYQRRLRALGSDLGDFPVSGYFWGKARSIHTPAEFVCAMSLTFENANLDHSAAYARAARQAGDRESAALLDRIHADEIGHVRFGREWLERFKAEGVSIEHAYLENLRWPLRPALARGREFDPRSRIRAGLGWDFIRMLQDAGDRRGPGKPRREA
jgi:uncharacterized ferritin-like protein (DUF455 family)